MLAAMDAARIAELLEPFLGGEPLSPALAAQLQTYLELLLRWNARINLTAVHDPEQIVTRHFGESLFAARVLRDAGALVSPVGVAPTLADVGSGAGFPGIPIKLIAPELPLTLIESQNKKAAFLREVVRTLGIDGAEVFSGRAEAWNHRAAIVTLRAVEKFESALPIAAALAAHGGTLCLLIGASQTRTAQELLGPQWQLGIVNPIPDSVGRVALMGKQTT
jgi:16S rRNA (guanine527-N7)-methyltransferase